MKISEVLESTRNPVSGRVARLEQFIQLIPSKYEGKVRRLYADRSKSLEAVAYFIDYGFPKCLVCGKDIKRYTSTKHFSNTCSASCSAHSGKNKDKQNLYKALSDVEATAPSARSQVGLKHAYNKATGTLSTRLLSMRTYFPQIKYIRQFLADDTFRLYLKSPDILNVECAECHRACFRKRARCLPCQMDRTKALVEAKDSDRAAYLAETKLSRRKVLLKEARRYFKDTSQVCLGFKNLTSTVLRVKCTECGVVRRRHLPYLKKYECQCLSGEKVAKSQRIPVDLFKARARLAERNLRLISEFKGLNHRIRLKCLTCKHVWTPIALNTQKGSGCPVCAPENRKKNNLEKYGVEQTTQRKDVQEKMRQTMVAKYGVEHALQNVTLFTKMLDTSERLKPYTLGKKQVWLQGYEPQAIDWLLKNTKIQPSQIECGSDNRAMPRIDYKYKGSWHSYYPDLYIPHLNMIVEVKSSYTYNNALLRNKAKARACKKKGFKFKFLVMQKSGERLYDY